MEDSKMFMGLNSLVVIVVGLVAYFLSKLYQARMLFIRRKRMGLVRFHDPPSMSTILIVMNNLALRSASQLSVRTPSLPQKALRRLA